MEDIVVVEMSDGVATVYEAPEHTEVLVVDWDRIAADASEAKRLVDLLQGSLGELMPAEQLDDLVAALASAAERDGYRTPRPGRPNRDMGLNSGPNS
jgi:hypothetical protein